MKKQTLRVGGRLLSLQKPLVMGILNVTPDSFHAQSRHENTQSLLRKAEEMLTDGATILDIGGYSTRPDAPEVSEQMEIDRVLPSVEQLRNYFPQAILSVDTFRAKVAEHAICAGAHIINDVSGGDLDTQMFEVVARHNVPYILMHSRGTPQTMQQLTDYQDIVVDVMDFLQKRIAVLREKGVTDIVVDLGFGFAKTLDQNYELLAQMSLFEHLDCPMLVGISRKSMITKFLGVSAAEALNGTTVLNTLALERGAAILRVHDVKEAMQAVKIYNKLQQTL